MVDLSVRLGRLALTNPILVASGTFGYVREMAGFVRVAALGGVIPKTVTPPPSRRQPDAEDGRDGRRACSTRSGSITTASTTSDRHHLPYLRTVGTAVIANIAGEDEDQFVAMAASSAEEPGLAAIELNISCPNVSHGLDLGIDPAAVGRLVSRCPRGRPAADHRQADAERHRHRRHRPRRERGRGRRREPGQHLPRPRRRLADAAGRSSPTTSAA